MKKRLLIALFVALTVCVFAFTVSAANEVTLTDGTTADLATVFKVNDNQVTGFNTGYTKDDVTDVIFPDEIVGIESNVLFNSAANLKTLTFAATDTFFISGDGIFTNCSVEKITFNPDCVVEIRKGNFSNCTSLTEITFPKFKKLAGSSFKDCTKMVATNELVLEEGMTEIGGHAFNGCTSLSGTVRFPASLQKIQEYSFQNTGFEYFDLSKCANLTAVGGGYGGPFTDNDNITTLDLSGCTSLTALKGNFAANCDNLTNVILPPKLKTIPSKAFAHCYKLQSIVLPASVTYIEDEAFHSARSGQTIKTFTVYVQSNVQFGTKYYPFRDSGAKIEFVLIGDNVTVESFQAVNTYSAITNATIVDYLDPASPWTYTTGGAITAHTIVKNYCKPLAVNGEHLYSTNPCVKYCTSCKLATAQENPQHNISTSIVYANGYNNAGSVITGCTNDGCTHSAENEAKALFECQGFSASLTGDGISLGFKVNNEAIAAYTDATGKTLKYGVFAASQSKLGEEDIFDTDGNANANAIVAEIARTDFAAFDIKVMGFANDSQKNAPLAMGAYVKTSKDGVTEYSYMQASKPDGGNYYFDSYSNILAELTAKG
ncbi:MAG: leucine-rich repeat protein [Clostridia bacterium]|nr:leucine-rich repeat protein [Clostridia bacterium]